MKKIKMFLIGAHLLTTPQTYAFIERSEPSFDKINLVELIQSNNSISEIEHLIPNLPGPFRMNFTLKHGIKRTGERGHLFEEDVSQSADPHAPRAIIWDERTGFSISYNGGLPNQTANQRLDLISFDKKTKTFALEQIDFPITPTQSKITTSDCNRCHGPNQRPIFSMYPDWPSFYGSDNDELTGLAEVQKKEISDYTHFIHTAKTNNRYLPLYDQFNIKKYLGIDGYQTFPYRENVSEVSTDISRAFAFRPGLRLGVLYNRMTVQMITNKILNHSNYKLLNKFFAFNLLQCQISSGSEVKLTKYSSFIEKTLKIPLKIRSNKLLDYSQLLALFDLKINDVDIRYNYNSTGYENKDATKKIMEIGYIGNYLNSYFDGSATFDELASAVIVKNLTLANPRLNNPKIYRGLTEKYQKFTDRFKLDKEFFAEMDSWGKWIAMPFPAIISAPHHREKFTTEMQNYYNNVCAEIEKTL